MDNMTLEEIKDELRNRYPGTTSIFLEEKIGNVYLSIGYKPLKLNVKVPFSEDIDILCKSYVDILIARIDLIIAYHNSAVISLENVIHKLNLTSTK